MVRFHPVAPIHSANTKKMIELTDVKIKFKGLSIFGFVFITKGLIEKTLEINAEKVRYLKRRGMKEDEKDKIQSMASWE